MKTEDVTQPYKRSMELCRYIDSGNCKPKKIRKYWRRTFMGVAKYLGFSKTSRRILWKELARGNQSRLSWAETRQAHTVDKWRQELRANVWYASDRWSLDRLAHCHWIYRQYEQAALLENATDDELRQMTACLERFQKS